MEDCIFCKIARGEIPCARLYEDDRVLAFLDINPVAPGHALVMTKGHFPTVFETPEEDLAACIRAVKKVAGMVFRAVGAEGMNILQNNHRASGQLVDHLHFHLIPRRRGDGFLSHWPGKPYPEGEMKRVHERILAEG